MDIMILAGPVLTLGIRNLFALAKAMATAGSRKAWAPLAGTPMPVTRQVAALVCPSCRAVAH